MFNPVIVIPVFQHGELLGATVSRLLALDIPLIVVNDGSDALQSELIHKACQDEQVLLINRPFNGGKGAAVIDGLREAKNRGYSHAFQIDGDGQHDTSNLSEFTATSRQNPDALILGYPQYDETVPLARQLGRRLTQLWVCINTLSFRIRDSMCGFRIYPISSILEIIDHSNIGKHMEFDVELCVRALWKGLPVVNLPVLVTYPEDGKSNFRVFQDNLLISFMHARLFVGMLLWLSKRLLRWA